MVTETVDAVFTHSSGGLPPTAPAERWRVLRKEILTRLKLDLLLYDHLYFPVSELLTNRGLTHLLIEDHPDAIGDQVDPAAETATITQELFREHILRVVAFDNSYNSNPITDTARAIKEKHIASHFTDPNNDVMRNEKELLRLNTQWDLWQPEQTFREDYGKRCISSCNILSACWREDNPALSEHMTSLKLFLQQQDAVLLSRIYQQNDANRLLAQEDMSASLNIYFKHLYTTLAWEGFTRKHPNRNVHHSANFPSAQLFRFLAEGPSPQKQREPLIMDKSLHQIARDSSLARICDARGHTSLKVLRAAMEKYSFGRADNPQLVKAYAEACANVSEILLGKTRPSHSLLPRVGQIATKGLLGLWHPIVAIRDFVVPAFSLLTDLGGEIILKKERPKYDMLIWKRHLEELYKYRDSSVIEMIAK